jgi:hypothetical protein
MKKKKTQASPNKATTSRRRGGMALTMPGKPIWAPRRAASADP